MKSILLIFVMLISIAQAGLPAPPPKVELKKPGDSAAIAVTGNVMVVSITSETGIGEATLTRTGDKWPARIVIRLGVRSLESFDMQNGIIQFNTSMKSPKQMPYWKIGTNPSPPNSPDGVLDAIVSRAEGVMTITVPKEMMEGNPKTMTVGWIDAYRN
jgi:hypothetical protein